MAPFCIECGKSIPYDAKFCQHCGTAQPVIEKKVQPQPFAPTTPPSDHRIGQDLPTEEIVDSLAPTNKQRAWRIARWFAYTGAGLGIIATLTSAISLQDITIGGPINAIVGGLLCGGPVWLAMLVRYSLRQGGLKVRRRLAIGLAATAFVMLIVAILIVTGIGSQPSTIVTQVVRITATSRVSAPFNTATPDFFISTPNRTIAARNADRVDPLPNVVTHEGRNCIKWTDARNHVGEYTCVYGIITHVHDATNASFIDFDSRSTSFYLVTFNYYLEDLDLEGYCVVALGSISLYEGRPQMEIPYPDTQLFDC